MAAGTLPGLLGQLPQAVEAQLGRTDGVLSRDVKYHFAKFGATRLKRDGAVQIGRQDRKVLEQLASGTGDQQNPAWQARASKALDNVMKAHLERLPAAIAGDVAKGHGRGIGGASAAAVGMGTVSAAVGSTDLIGKPVAELTQVAVNRLAESARMVVSDLTPGDVWTAPVTTWQTMGAFAVAGAAMGAGEYLHERSERLGQERAVPAAWTQAHGADVRHRLGISLPNPPQSSADGARMQAVAATAQRLGQVRGSDPRAVLTEFVSTPAADRPRMEVAPVQERVVAVGTGDGPALSGLPPAGSKRVAGEAAVARPAGAETGRKPEGRSGPNG